jgi:hypothetical protein
MPRAIGMGSHFILVFLRAELSRDRKDFFLWKFCWSKAVRDEENVREGAVRRAWQRLGLGHCGRMLARMSWRECAEAMAIALLDECPVWALGKAKTRRYLQRLLGE